MSIKLKKLRSFQRRQIQDPIAEFVCLRSCTGRLLSARTVLVSSTWSVHYVLSDELTHGTVKFSFNFNANMFGILKKENQIQTQKRLQKLSSVFTKLFLVKNKFSNNKFIFDDFSIWKIIQAPKGNSKPTAS